MLGRILVVIGGLLVIALFAALLAPYFIDWTDFRRDFEVQASRIIGKKVVVHGTVDASLLPFPSVTMNDVRVGEDSEGKALVTAERFSMESELAPFLSGEALIYNMRVENPKLLLRLTEDGTFDWVKTGTPEIPAANVVLENVTITNGEILFIDQQTGRNRSLTGLNLQLSAKTLAGPWKVSGSGAVDGQPGTFVMNTSVPEQGKMHLKLRLLPKNPAIVAELDGSIGLNQQRPQYTGSFNIREKYRSETDAESETANATQSAAPRISGSFELANDRLRIPAYEFKMGDPVDPYVVTGEATIDAGRQPEFLLTADGQQVDMTRFGASSEGTVEGEIVAIPLADRVRALMTLAADVPIPPFPGKATVKLPAIVTKDTVIRDIRLEMRPDGDGWNIDEAEASLPGRTMLSAKGKLSLTGDQGFTGELLLASTQPSGFAEWLTGGVPDAIRKLKTAGFSANVSLTPDLQRFENLEIAFGPASLKGRLEHLAPSGEVPSLSTELSGNVFDLDTMLALGGLMTGESSSKSLFGHRIAAKLKIDDFSAFGLKATGVDTAFSLSNGAIGDVRLSVRDFYGAALTLEGGLADIANVPKGEAKLTVKAEDPTDLFKLMAERLPAHPALKRLAENAHYYEGADLALGLKLGLGDWPVEANLTGLAHGSKLSATLAAQTLDLANPDGLTLDAAIENPDVWVMLGQAGLTTSQFDADQDGLLTLKINQPAETDPQVTLAYSSGTTTLTVEGQSRLDATNFLNGSYNVSLDSGDLAPYLMMTGLTLPRMTEGLPLTLSTSIYATPEAQGFEDIKGDADGNVFTGFLSHDRKLPDSGFAGDLAFKSIDLPWLGENVFGQVSDPLSNHLSSMTMPKTAGLPVKATLALSAEAFHLGDLGTIDNFTATFKSEGGKMEIAGAKGRLADGAFIGRAEFGNNDGNGYFRTQLKVSDASLKTAFWSKDGAPVASAKSNLTLVLDATGNSPATMLASATGSGALTLFDMKVKGLDASAFPRILAAADAISGELTEAAVRPDVEKSLLSGETRISQLSIPFAVTGGRLRADNIIGNNPAMDIEASSNIALSEASIDATVAMTFKAGEDALAGAEPVVVLNWQGPLAAPQRSLDITGLTSYLSLRKFEQERRRVEILQASIAEKQRLRREAALYRARDAERARLLQKAADEARLMQSATEALKALAKKEAEEAAKRPKVETQEQKLQEQQELDQLIRDMNALPVPAQ